MRRNEKGHSVDESKTKKRKEEAQAVVQPKQPDSEQAGAEGKIEQATTSLRNGGSLLLLGPRWWAQSVTRRIMTRLASRKDFEHTTIAASEHTTSTACQASIESVLCTSVVSASDAQGWDRIGAERVRTIRDEEHLRRLLSVPYAKPKLDLSALRSRHQSSLALMVGAMLGVAVATASSNASEQKASLAEKQTPSDANPTPSVPSSTIQTPSMSEHIWDDDDLVDDTSEDEDIDDGWVTEERNEESKSSKPEESKSSKPSGVCEESKPSKPSGICEESKPLIVPAEKDTKVRILDHISYLIPKTKKENEQSVWNLLGAGPILCNWISLLVPLCPPLCPASNQSLSSESEGELFDFLCHRAISLSTPIIICEPSSTTISPITLARFSCVLRFW